MTKLSRRRDYFLSNFVHLKKKKKKRWISVETKTITSETSAQDQDQCLRPNDNKSEIYSRLDSSPIALAVGII